jgi:translation initiation factor IF-1
VAGDTLVLEGVVVHVGRGDVYEVDCQAGALRRKVLAKRAGRLARGYIRIVAGDHVRVEVSPYDLSRGRIVHRLDGSQPQGRP